MAVVWKVNRLRIASPECLLDLPFRKRSHRDGLAMTVSVGYIKISYTRAIPCKRNVPAIRRPSRVGRVLDLNQLLDRKLCGFRAVLRGRARHKGERHDQHDLDHF